MIETIVYLVAFVISMLVILLSVWMVTRIAPAIAQINANADVRKTRVEARADMAMQESDYREADSESEGEPNMLDMGARMLGYSDLSSAISDPAIMSKVSGLLSGKNEVQS